MYGWMRWLLKREWLVIIVGAVIFLRIPTLLEPYWYGDEGVYLTVGEALRNGEVLYRDIHDNKPPLIYIVAAIANGTLFWYRFIAAGWNILAVVVFALLARKVFVNKKIAYLVAAWVFAIMTNIPLWEGNIANAENFFLLPTLLAAYLLFSIPVAKWKARVFGAGILFGVAGLFKMPAILEMGVWPLIWLATNERDKVQKIIILGVGVALPILLAIGYFGSIGVVNEFLIAAGVQNVPYLNTWKTGIGQVVDMRMRVALAAIAIGVIWGWTSRLGRNVAWVGMWTVIVVFAALLSGRPYAHYLLQTVPVLALGVGMIWEKKALVRRAGLAIIFSIGIVCFGYSFWKYSVAGYYGNYIKWITGIHDKDHYYQWFNSQVTINYKIAEEIKRSTEFSDEVFVWGDEPAIYSLADRSPVGKYVARYHVFDFGAQDESIKLLNKGSPPVIVSFGGEEQLPGLNYLLESRYMPIRKFGTATVYKLGRKDW